MSVTLDNLPPDLESQLRFHANSHGRNLSDEIVQLLREAVDERKAARNRRLREIQGMHDFDEETLRALEEPRQIDLETWK